MQNHLRQANRNYLKLLRSERDFPDEDFEWKTTYAFYVVVHWTRAFIRLRLGMDVDIPDHSTARRLLKQYLKPFAFKAYITLNNYADYARYDGVADDFDRWQRLRKLEYKEAREILEMLRMEIGRAIPEVLTLPTLPE